MLRCDNFSFRERHSTPEDVISPPSLPLLARRLELFRLQTKTPSHNFLKQAQVRPKSSFRSTLDPESKSVVACYRLAADDEVLALSELHRVRNC